MAQAFVPAFVPDFERAQGFDECDQDCESCDRSYDDKVKLPRSLSQEWYESDKC